MVHSRKRIIILSDYTISLVHAHNLPVLANYAAQRKHQMIPRAVEGHCFDHLGIYTVQVFWVTNKAGVVGKDRKREVIVRFRKWRHQFDRMIVAEVGVSTV